MKKFIVCDDFWEIFPEACFGIVVAKNVNTDVTDAEVNEAMKELLANAQQSARKHITCEEFSENPIIKEWREAFRKFKTKKGTRSSIESLLKRVHLGNGITSISPVVDIYNAMSLKYGFSCGGEDIDTFVGDLRITVADGSEEFYLIGSDVCEPPYPGEIVYKDDAGAVCRCFNWREAKRTMLTEQSKNIFMSMEVVNRNRLDELKSAVDELSALIKKYTSADVECKILDINNKEIRLMTK